MAEKRQFTVSRILGQTFLIGDISIKLVAINRNKVRLEVELPENVDIEDYDDYKEIINKTIVMQDDRGWRRAIPRASLEAQPLDLHRGKEGD